MVGEIEYVNRIEILDTGELFLGIEGDGSASYQYVYREAAGVYWDPASKGFKSTELKGWTPAQWFVHMIGIVRTGLGIRLLLRDSVHWKNIPDQERAAIVAAQV